MSAPKRSSRRSEVAGERHGVFLVDKPVGLTSHDVVAGVRRIPGVRRAGHAGTLDPMATGLLLVCVNEATKASRFLMAVEKEYTASVLLGRETDTEDITGRTLRESDCSGITVARIEKEAAGLVGEQSQVPPMFSAVKQAGVRLHVLARSGLEVEREPRKVTIHSLTVLEVALPEVSLRVACSKGTYIRTLAAELGKRLGCGATLAGLRRVRSGEFRIEQAVPFTTLLDDGNDAVAHHLLPLTEALSEWTPLRVDAAEAGRAAHGQPPDAPAGSKPEERVMILDPGGSLVALAEVVEERSGRMRLRTLRVLHGQAPAPKGVKGRPE